MALRSKEMSEEEIVDMEKQPSTSEELSDIYKRLFHCPYESLPPEAAVLLCALLQ